jgi:hypothetical protein
MKQYKRIWVKSESVTMDGGFKVWEEGFAGSNFIEEVEPIKYCIVLSLEQLREVWDESREETWQDARPTTQYEKPHRLPGFEGYLQSKGIKTDNNG